MSEESEAVDTVSCCASCGIAEIDDIKLMDCDGCDLVRYCSDECKENHKTEHKEDCKKRAAELREEILFKQPKSTHLGDCPICSLPMPHEPRRYISYECCSKVICKGCFIANLKREKEMRLQRTCPFCREPVHLTAEENDKLRMKRIEANDPSAMCEEGIKQYKKGDYIRAFEYFTKAVELGYAEAHYQLAWLYQRGQGVDEDEGKYFRHLEEASIGGHPRARTLLGIHEYSNNNLDRAVKHWIIAATQGEDKSVKALMDGFKEGYVEKEVLAAAFRAHKAAGDAIKSPERK